MDLEQFTDDLRWFLYDEGYVPLQIEDTDIGVALYLDIPSESNYDYYVNMVRAFFAQSEYDISDFTIDGDYEGQIELEWIG